jgi:hypothetical protein
VLEPKTCLSVPRETVRSRDAHESAQVRGDPKVKKKPLPSPRLAAAAVMDPDLVGKDRDFLERAERRPRSYSEGEMSVWWATAPRLVRPGAVVVGLAGGSWVTGEWKWYDPSAHDGRATASDVIGRNMQGFFDALHSALTFAWLLGAMCRFGVGGWVSVTACQIVVFVLVAACLWDQATDSGWCLVPSWLSWGGTPCSAPLS